MTMMMVTLVFLLLALSFRSFFPVCVCVCVRVHLFVDFSCYGFLFSLFPFSSCFLC